MLMDEQKVDRAMMWPTLASLLEERLADDPKATAVVVHALNEWMHEHWTFNFENRIFATPVINLSSWTRPSGSWTTSSSAAPGDPDPARPGARLRTPPPIDGAAGVRPVLELVQESGVLVGMHSSDDGYSASSTSGTVASRDSAVHQDECILLLVNSEYRSIRDTVYSIIGHGLATRFPDLRFMPVENGSQWVPTALKQFKKLYDRTGCIRRGPDGDVPALDRHPSLLRGGRPNIVELVGADNVVFGSDFPHPEGLGDPLSFVDEIEPLSEEDKAKIMGGTLSKLMQCDPTEKVVAAA